MARRIIYARNSGYYSDRERALWIDRWVEIDCKDKVFVDQSSGDVAIEQPNFVVSLPSRTFEGVVPRSWNGRVDNPDDIAWLKQAAYRSTTEGNIRIDTPVKVVSRIHQLRLRRDGYEGFEVEVLTGENAEAMIKTAKRQDALATLKEVWWLIPVGLGLLWIIF